MSGLDRLDLPQVTVVAVDTATPALAARALAICQSQCRFAEAILFADQTVDAACRIVRIPPIRSREEYSAFVLDALLGVIRTPHVLVVQWDGYVTDPGAWHPEFLNTDYLGARWPWFADGFTVGNGGFSLRSSRLLEAIATPGFVRDANEAEDVLIARTNRRYLEARFGIRFGSEAQADRFAYERARPTSPTFGFHGLFNMWRHLDDATMLALLAALPARSALGRECLELMLHYLLAGNSTLFGAMYRRARAQTSEAGLDERLGILEIDAPTRSLMMACGQALSQPRD